MHLKIHAKLFPPLQYNSAPIEPFFKDSNTDDLAQDLGIFVTHINRMQAFEQGARLHIFVETPGRLPDNGLADAR